MDNLTDIQQARLVESVLAGSKFCAICFRTASAQSVHCGPGGEEGALTELCSFCWDEWRATFGALPNKTASSVFDSPTGSWAQWVKERLAKVQQEAT